MHTQRTLTQREKVFVMSLMYHGFRYTTRCTIFKKRVGYIRPGTRYDDDSGVDFWIRMPGAIEFQPVQVTQRGVKMFRAYKTPTQLELSKFIIESDSRIRKKRKWCRRDRVVFILVRDTTLPRTNPTLAWGDIKATRYAMSCSEK